MSKETLKRALFRGLYIALGTAFSAWALIPINLNDPKKYLYASLIALASGFIAGTHKALKGYFKYDVNK